MSKARTATDEEEGGDNEMEPLIHFHGRL